MALKIHPKGSEGVYEDNLPWVAGVEVVVKKAKRYDDDEVAWIKVEVRKEKKIRIFYFEKEKIRGPIRFEDRTVIVLRQWCQKACWVF